MENASKALLMAAGVLVGVLIISIGVYLFSTYAEYSSDTYKKMEATQIDQFNTQFLKYYRDFNDVEGPILCTAHDIVSLANLAQENNKKLEIDNLTKYDINTRYIQIDVDKKIGNTKLNNLEWESNNDLKLKFLQTSTGYYICKTNPIISNITKRVCYMQFIEYNP